MIKKTLKSIIAAILRWEARQILRRYRPKVVGITGSVGKTGTKEAVARVLSLAATTRRNEKSFNGELGVPLTIIGVGNAWSNPLGWLKNILAGLNLILFRADYPEWLVLELGVDRPGDIRRVIKWLKFEVVVITRLPELPVHAEFFASPEALKREKLLLIEGLAPGGCLIFNADDPAISPARPPGRVLTYGFNEGVTVRGSNDHLTRNERGVPVGLTVKVDYQGSSVPFRLPGLIGHHQLYGVLAAVAVGLSRGINLVSMAAALEDLGASPGRFQLLPGIKDSLIIDDSYNSSPVALEAALQTLSEVATKARKIAVLGDMMELGGHTVEAHREAGRQAAAVCDLLITVGPRAKFINEEAAKKLKSIQLLHFDAAREAGEALGKLIQPGDFVLIKGSQSVRLEHLVEQIMLQPEDREKLLFRHEPEWRAKSV